MTTFPLIVVGTYEEFVLGYSLQFENENNIKFKLHQSFATHSHQASLRSIAAHNTLMASSGADEYINIYDMVGMEVSTVINYHNSTVTCLEFTPDGSHLVTANQNGDIAIFRCKDWALVKLWKEAHKHANGVISISVHPSGSLLLTTGADNIVRFWNLIKGRQAYAVNYSKKCSTGSLLNFGIWSKNGNFYAICIGNMLEIYETKTAAVVYEIQAHARITCLTFIKKNLICLATENGLLEIHSISKKKIIIKKQAHKSRIKGLTFFNVEVYKNNKNVVKNYVVSVDSSGRIQLWYLKKKGLSYSLLLRGEADCSCRITCLTMVTLKNIKKEESEANELNVPSKIQEITTTNKQNKEIKIDNKCRHTQFVKKKIKNNTKKRKQQITNKSNSILNSKKLKLSSA